MPKNLSATDCSYSQLIFLNILAYQNISKKNFFCDPAGFEFDIVLGLY